MKTASKRQRAKRPRHASPEPRIELPTITEAIEQVLISGDLTPLSPEQRLQYYRAVCKSLGLNPLTRPFDYIYFKATETSPPKLALYARKDCTEQLRKIHGVSVTRSTNRMENGVLIVSVEVRDNQSRTDAATGVVPLYGVRDGQRYEFSPVALANAIMKAETKAKRRATLSICGLGILDESELDTMDVQRMTPEGRAIMEQGGNGSLEAAQAVAQRKIAEHAAKGLPAKFAVEEKPENTVYAHFHQRQQGVVYLWGALQTVEEHIKNDFLGVKQQVSGYWTIPMDKVPALKELCGYRHLFWKEVDILPSPQGGA